MTWHAAFLGNLAQGLAAAAMLGLAVWLLTLNARSVAVRLLAGFLVSYGVVAGLAVLPRPDPATAQALSAVNTVAFIHSAAALLLLSLIFPLPVHPRLDRPALALLPVAVTLLVAAVGVARDALGIDATDLRLASVGLGNLAYASAFLICAIRLPRLAGQQALRSGSVLAMALSGLTLAFTGAITYTWLVLGRQDSIVTGSVAGFALALVALALLAHSAFLRRPRTPGAAAPLFLGLAGLATAILSFLIVGGFWVGAYWRLLLPILLAWGVLRHQFLGLDARVNWTIRRGTVAAALIAAFVVASEVAQNVLSEEHGVLAGGLAAGALLVAIHPLQRMADRVAQSAAPLPGTTPREVYAEAVRLALVDGTITPEEERQLAVLASRLKLSPLEALEARRAVEAAPPSP